MKKELGERESGQGVVWRWTQIFKFLVHQVALSTRGCLGLA